MESVISEGNLKKHVRFLKRHLTLLPASKQSYDVNRLAIVFYAMATLSSLGEDVSHQYKENIAWIETNYIVRNTDVGKLSGFIGSASLNIPGTMTLSLPNTLFGLLTILILKDKQFIDKKIDRESLFHFVSQCQLRDTGSFVSVLDYHTNQPSPVDAHDLRFSYIAVAILYILGCRTESDFGKYVDVIKLVEYIQNQACDIGGFGTLGEPHAGYTSCALSALALLGKLDAIDPDHREQTIQWILDRQVSNLGAMATNDISNEWYDENDHGGFQGRENKYADTCYAFWCLNSLKILEPNFTELCDTALVKSYLLDKTQDILTGGFMKNDEEDADIYHTCLGVATLRLIDGRFNGLLCIPDDVSFE